MDYSECGPQDHPKDSTGIKQKHCRFHTTNQVNTSVSRGSLEKIKCRDMVKNLMATFLTNTSSANILSNMLGIFKAQKIISQGLEITEFVNYLEQVFSINHLGCQFHSSLPGAQVNFGQYQN